LRVVARLSIPISPIWVSLSPISLGLTTLSSKMTDLNLGFTDLIEDFLRSCDQTTHLDKGPTLSEPRCSEYKEILERFKN